MLKIAVCDDNEETAAFLQRTLAALTHTQEKHLKLVMEYSQETLFIKIQNTFDGKVSCAPHESARVVSQKPGGGHGLKTITRTVEKYNSTLKISHTENLFTAIILLYAGKG